MQKGILFKIYICRRSLILGRTVQFFLQTCPVFCTVVCVQCSCDFGWSGAWVSSIVLWQKVLLRHRCCAYYDYWENGVDISLSCM